MGPYLVFPSGIDRYIQQGISLPAGQNGIPGHGFLAQLSFGGVHPVGFALGESGAAQSAVRQVLSFHDGPVAPLFHKAVPILLKGVFYVSVCNA